MADSAEINLDVAAIAAAVSAAIGGGGRRGPDPAAELVKQASDLGRQMQAATARIAKISPPPKIERVPTFEEVQDAQIRQMRRERSRQRFYQQLAREGMPPASEAGAGFLGAVGGLQMGFGATGMHGAAGVMGTIGQFGSVLGKINPVGLGVAATLGLVATAASSAARTLTAVGQTMAATGGTAAQTMMGRILAGAVGMDPAGLTGLAHGFRERITGGGLAMSEAARLGISGVAPRGIRPENEQEILLRAISGLMAEPNAARAQLTAERIPELEPFLILREASDRTKAHVRQLADEMSRGFSAENRAKAVAYNLEMSAFNEKWGALVAEIGPGFMQAMTNGVGTLLNAWKSLEEHTTGAGNMFAKPDFAGARRGEKPQTAEEKARERQAGALDANTRALVMLREGLYGGGQWAARSIPAGLRGEALSKFLNQQTARLGAF